MALIRRTPCSLSYCGTGLLSLGTGSPLTHRWFPQIASRVRHSRSSIRRRRGWSWTCPWVLCRSAEPCFHILRCTSRKCSCNPYLHASSTQLHMLLFATAGTGRMPGGSLHVWSWSNSIAATRDSLGMPRIWLLQLSPARWVFFHFQVENLFLYMHSM